MNLVLYFIYLLLLIFYFYFCHVKYLKLGLADVFNPFKDGYA